MKQNNKRRFHLGDVLTVTTDRLVSKRHMDGVYDILGFLVGEGLSTLALPRVIEEVRPHVLRKYPQLAPENVDFSGMDEKLKPIHRNHKRAEKRLEIFKEESPEGKKWNKATEMLSYWAGEWNRRQNDSKYSREEVEEARIRFRETMELCRTLYEPIRRREERIRKRYRRQEQVAIRDWFKVAEKKFGRTFTLEPIPAEDHVSKPPHVEAQEYLAKVGSKAKLVVAQPTIGEGGETDYVVTDLSQDAPLENDVESQRLREIDTQRQKEDEQLRRLFGE